MSQRISNHPVLGPLPAKETCSFSFDDDTFQGLVGEPIAAALLANGVRVLRRHEASGNPRGIYCAIGHCMECRVHVEGMGTVRSCLTPLKAGMVIRSGEQLPNPIVDKERY